MQRTPLELLRELHALVLGECPSLLNEDSGGDGNLALDIQAALETEGAAPFGWYCELVHERSGEVIRDTFCKDAPLEGPSNVKGFVWRATPVVQ